MAMHPMQHLSLLTSQEHALVSIAMQMYGVIVKCLPRVAGVKSMISCPWWEPLQYASATKRETSN